MLCHSRSLLLERQLFGRRRSFCDQRRPTGWRAAGDIRLWRTVDRCYRRSSRLICIRAGTRSFVAVCNLTLSHIFRRCGSCRVARLSGTTIHNWRMLNDSRPLGRNRGTSWVRSCLYGAWRWVNLRMRNHLRRRNLLRVDIEPCCASPVARYETHPRRQRLSPPFDSDSGYC